MNTCLNKNYRTIAISIILGLLVTIFLWVWRSQISEYRDEVIARDIAQLSRIFNDINRSCHIVGFDYPYNIINFLTVINFYGNGVGSMNLKNADQWKGPYVQKNLTIQSLDYVVRKVKNGSFITPADGVSLSNGKVIGKDIILNEQTDIEALAQDPAYLLSETGPLAAKIGAPPLISTTPGVLDQLLLDDSE